MTSTTNGVTPPYQTEHVLMTPEKALDLLTTNTANRRLNKRIVQSLVSDIEDGRWKDTVLSRTVSVGGGRLIDGQHRLHAIVETETPLPMTLVTYDEGVDADDVQLHTDIGWKRTLVQQLEFLDITNANNMAALARLVWVEENDADMTRQSTWVCSDSELIQIASTREDELLGDVRAGGRLHNHTRMTTSVGSWFHYRVRRRG